MKLSDDAKAVLVLTTRLGDPQRPALPPGQWHSFSQALGDSGLRPCDVFSPDALERMGLDPERRARIDTLVADAAHVMVDLESVSARGIWAITAADEDYPERLRTLDSLAPPVIFGVGDHHLLGRRGVGIVGSRDVGPDGVDVAREVATAAAEESLTVLSGAARGVDQQAMAAAYQAGGSVIGVLADSLERQIKTADVRSSLDAGTTCLVTQQHPKTGFTPAAAMARNKLVYAMASATFVVASGLKGGTWEGATEALRRGFGRVAVWRGPGQGPGNAELEKLGARSVDKVADLFEYVAEERLPEHEQLTIELS
ncbi:MAG: DNA-processing protein DprA [Acidimicrobiia bacterium]